ncbi:MAG: NAD-dependent epimerase [Deltaproteobacteria bacterium]|nr:NAD-dependent epimerase [Deltaproteobacteria bacterium]
MKRILVTGSAGFIGFHLSKRLLDNGFVVFGIDNLNEYYDVTLKKSRLHILEAYDTFTFFKADISHREAVADLFKEKGFEVVVHLAAQPGVRYSLVNPDAYVSSNLVGFANILEGCRHSSIDHLIFASSSSVYGGNREIPFSVNHNVDHPISLYAATKKSNELMAHSYASLFNLPCTGLRFFTVYGPWGRPDMAYFLFTRALFEGNPIDVYNYGRMKRDFTYVDDIVGSLLKLIGKIPDADPDWKEGGSATGSSFAPYKIYNIGGSNPVELKRFIEILEQYTGRRAVKNLLPMQPGDMLETLADVGNLEETIGYRPTVGIEEGLRRFVEWYRDYYGIND